MRRTFILGFLVLVLAFAVGCTNKKVNNPLANVGSKQPDKVLFDRAMDAMKHNRFDVARMTLQTLINTYPDSEYIARAKLAVADSWYAEGGSAAMQQAEAEYKDFRTFFPNMPEAAEAQLKVADIHYNEMEKPDRDFTHAMRAEEEYRALIQEYPDSKLVPRAKQRLREVEEVLAQREFNIGRFYYLRQSYPAAIARLKTLVDRYPLYSGADDALYLLGQSYEGEIALVRANPRANEVAKTKLIEQFTKDAAEQYSRIITRYPAMDRAVDAKDRLQALHQTVPRPTRAALELNKKEMASRLQSGAMANVMGTFEKRPDVSRAAHMGEPTMQDNDPVTPGDIIRRANQALIGGDNTVKAQAVSGSIPQSQEVPRSDAQPTETAAPPQPAPQPEQPAAAAQDQPNPAAGELKPNVAADPNELKPNVAPDGNELPAPTQTNEIQSGSSSSSATASSSSSSKDDLVDISSSRKKKKKGLAKLKPF